MLLWKSLVCFCKSVGEMKLCLCTKSFKGKYFDADVDTTVFTEFTQWISLVYSLWVTFNSVNFPNVSSLSLWLLTLQMPLDRGKIKNCKDIYFVANEYSLYFYPLLYPLWVTWSHSASVQNTLWMPLDNIRNCKDIICKNKHSLDPLLAIV